MHGVIVHELGHNLGFNHARTDLNNNGYDSSEGTDSGYGDNSDMMGSSRNWKKFNPPHAEDKGWIDPVSYEIREVTPGSSVQSFDLLPLRALKLERSSNTDYYVAFRRKTGDYNNLNDQYDNRVLVYYGFDNSTYSYHAATLAAGESFTDPVQDFVLTVTSTVDVVDGGNSTTAMGVEICRQSCSSIPAPSNLSATAQDTSSILLEWVDNSSDEDGFEIQRSADGSNWSVLTTKLENATSHTDFPLDASATWHYQVRATSPVENSGWSNSANSTTFGIPPTSDFTFFEDFLDVDFSDASVANHGAIVSWSWDFGDGGNSTQQNPSHSYASAGSRTVTLTVTDEHGDTDASNQSVTVTEPPPPPVTYHSALGDTPVAGTVSGNAAATADDDGTSQSIKERDSGGKKSNRYSYLEHRWNFSIPNGSSARVHVNAWHSISADDDIFDFAWSDDGNNWVRMFSTSASVDGPVMSFDLPADTEGTVYIRVTDTDQTPGNRSQDTVFVDFLQIEVSNLPPEPLEGTRPTALTAIATGHDTIEFNWVDNTSNESGFSIERSTDGSPFNEVGTAGMGVTSYSDTGLEELTEYSYRVSAYKGTEYTPASDVRSATTTKAPDITLSLAPYKVRGKHSVDLTWSGAAGSDVDIFRSGSNGPWETTTTNDGDYSHSTSYKGGATYTFKVCEAGSVTACSSEETVVF
jgi:PKD repeat protein